MTVTAVPALAVTDLVVVLKKMCFPVTGLVAVETLDYLGTHFH